MDHLPLRLPVCANFLSKKPQHNNTTTTDSQHNQPHNNTTFNVLWCRSVVVVWEHNTTYSQHNGNVYFTRPLCCEFVVSSLCCRYAVFKTRSSADADKPARRHVVQGLTMRGRVFAYFRFSKWQASTILDFYIFAIFVKKKSNLCLRLRRHAKFGEDRTIRGRVIAYFRFSKWRPSAILDLVWRHSSGPPTTCLMVLISS